LGVIFLLIFAVISAAMWLPFLGFFFTSPEYLSSEKVSVWLLILMLVVYVFVLVFLFSWSVVSRIKIIHGELGIWPAIKQGFKLAFRRYFSLTTLVFLFFLVHVFIFFAYWTVNDSGVVSLGWILFFMLLQQGVAFLRVMVRVMTYGGVAAFYLQD
jgi:hypothetical protein